ncbi:hypothetical protein Pcinc_008652 [Petrolisthes cinctipes]|uniref:Uncharacterized protein n=1 Tax=Petrolisthes cinctipes TaxID=88211 RepID=A0AAE1KVM2_PETCI|nr:hypothetical protein Pcinc_008652 [Petrolisthes cinctipes]
MSISYPIRKKSIQHLFHLTAGFRTVFSRITWLTSAWCARVLCVPDRKDCFAMAVTYGSTGPAEVASVGISIYRTAVKQGAEIDWMCQFCIIKEKANEEENFEGANFEAMSDNMEVSLVSSENLEFFEGDVANNMQASAVSSDSLENFEGACFEKLLSSNMEASAVSGEKLEYFEGDITNSSSSVEDPPPKEMPPSGDVVKSQLL